MSHDGATLQSKIRIIKYLLGSIMCCDVCKSRTIYENYHVYPPYLYIAAHTDKDDHHLPKSNLATHVYAQADNYSVRTIPTVWPSA